MIGTVAKSVFCIATPCVTAALAAMAPSAASVRPRPVARPVDCVAVVNAAALRAMGQTGPLGQLQIWGDPVAFGPNLLRVSVQAFGDGDYAVDVTIDPPCKVLSVTTRRESNGPP